MAATKATRREPAKDPERMSDDELAALLDQGGGSLDGVEFTYADAVRYLRRQRLICRGPIPEQDRAHVGALFAKGKDEEARQHDLATRGVRNRSTTELEPCGYDFVDMIAETGHPLDGSRMAYKCPKCGVEGEIQPAYLDITDRPDAKAYKRAHDAFLKHAHTAAGQRAKAKR